jgi:hypothetical protein
MDFSSAVQRVTIRPMRTQISSSTGAKKTSGMDDYSDQEASDRRDAALLRALSTPHKRQKEMKVGRGRSRGRKTVVEIDLSLLESDLHDRNGLVPNRLQGCVAEVFISPKTLAAILAFDFRRIGAVV